MLAACGLAAIDVVRRPKVAVLSTGDELVALGEPLRPGGVYDSNGAILAAAIAESRRRAGAVRRVPRRRRSARAGDAPGARECDMVVLSGGTSKGAGDLSHRVVVAARQARHPGAWRGAEARQAALPCGRRRQADRGAAGLSDLGDLHLPRLRRAGDPRPRRPAAGGRAKPSRRACRCASPRKWAARNSCWCRWSRASTARSRFRRPRAPAR